MRHDLDNSHQDIGAEDFPEEVVVPFVGNLLANSPLEVLDAGVQQLAKFLLLIVDLCGGLRFGASAPRCAAMFQGSG